MNRLISIFNYQELNEKAIVPLILVGVILISSYLLVAFMLPRIVYISRKKRILSPILIRSSHTTEIPRLGGFGLYFSFLIAILIINCIYHTTGELPLILISSTLIFVIGLYDDITEIKPISKLKGQIVAALPLLLNSNFTISFPHISTFSNVILSGLIIICVVVFIINAFNLIDGVDGLAGSIGIIICMSFSVIFFSFHCYSYLLMNIGLMSATAAFLKFNIRNDRFKIFMGDSGSLLIGFIIAVSTVKIIHLTTNAYEVETGLLNYANLIFAILFIPICDTIRVILIRLKEKRNPFSADRNHLHHFFIDYKKTHIQTVCIIATINLLLIIFNLLVFQSNFKFGILLNIVFTLCLVIFIKIKKNDKKNILS